MASSLTAIKQQLNQYWDKLNDTQKRIYITVIIALIIVVIISAFLLSREDLVVLYSGLNSQEAAEIYSRLKRNGCTTQD